MQDAVSGPDPQVPAAPVWLSIPTSVLKSGDSLPAGTRVFASGMERAETVTLAFALEGHGLAARLDVRCRDERMRRTGVPTHPHHEPVAGDHGGGAS